MLKIRAETPADYPAIDELNQAAFGQETESRLIEKLRQGPSFVPELSIVAERDGEIVGHILFTKVTLAGEQEWELLSLAPMAVRPDCQRQGIGLQLIQYGLAKANGLGFEAVVVLGHPEYYPQAGFRPASHWGIRCPWPAPDAAWMALELAAGALAGKKGVVKFPAAFEEAV